MSTLKVQYPDGGDFVEGRICWSALNGAARPRAIDTLDLSECVHLRPYAIACLCAIAARNQSNTVIKIIPPVNDECREHLERLGIFQWFAGHAPDRIDLRSTNVPVQQLTNGPGDFSDLAMRVWENEIGGVPAGVRPKLADSLDEVISNALQHSQSAIGCMVAGQAFPRTQRVEACVLDLGIGIPAHLTRAGHIAGGDAEYILLATEEGVTGTKGTLNSGVGLYELRSFVEAGGGSLTIISGSRYVVFRANEQPHVGDFWGGFGGTLLNLQFDTGFGLPTADMEAIL